MPEPARSAEGPVSHLLLTGATGFLGRHVARHLLGSGRAVIALARSRGDETAHDRVARAVGPVSNGARLSVVEGELTRPGGGLDPAAVARLRGDVETVIHCAGDTTFFPDDLASFRLSHIDGPLALLRALAGERLRRWVHISTAFVCGRRSGTVLESEGDLGQTFHNAYERVKLESEIALRAEGARLGVDVRVLRPAIVVGDAPGTAGGTPSARFFDFIRMVASFAQLGPAGDVEVRVRAQPRAPFNIVRVDDAARVIAALAEHPAGAGTTCHVVVPEPPTQETMLALIMEHVGVRGLRLVDGDAASPDAVSPLERMIAKIVGGYGVYLEQNVRFDDATARSLLVRVGEPPPSLDPAAVHQLIDLALALP